MDSKGSKKKSYNTKNKTGAPIVLQVNRDLNLNEENEMKQSLLSKPEKESCLVKNGRKDRGESAKKVHWKDDMGKRLVQIKEFPPDDSDDSDEEYVDGQIGNFTKRNRAIRLAPYHLILRQRSFV